MKILQVIPVFSALFGGPVTVVRSICKELSKRHEVTVYTTAAVDKRRDFKEFPVEDESEGFRIVYFPRILKLCGFNISPAMGKTLRESISKYDVVHLHSWRQFQDITVHRYAKKCNVPYILQAHGSLPRIGDWRRLKWIYDVFFGHRLLRDASKVIALSNAEAEQYKAMGAPEGKIAIIPNGIVVS
jgi:glycosyltransferase involved in cell wall biosynthesis